MLALITPLISHGVIDNTVRNTVTLQLWGIDGGEPLEYTMRGNCLRDIAGCRVSFVNKGAAPERREEHQVLRTLRDDHRMPIAGDITLSAASRTPTTSARCPTCSPSSSSSPTRCAS